MNKTIKKVLYKPIPLAINDNKLDLDNYLFSKHFDQHIFNSQIDKKKKNVYMNKDKGVYILRFSNVKLKGENVLVYNYIYYKLEFLLSLIVYFILRCYYKENSIHKEWGFYTVVLDNELLTDSIKERYIKTLNLSSGININWLFEDTLDELETIKNKDINSILRLITKLIYVNNCDNIINIFKFCLDNKYKEFVNFILYDDKTKELVINDTHQQSFKYSILTSSIFVINDLEDFLIRLSNNNFIINQGSKKWRGQINSHSSFLSQMDVDYRNSLFNHYNHHRSLGNVNNNHYLTRKHFSFQNIHQTINNVRWYSTRTRLNEEQQTSKFSTRQLLFENSFNIIDDIIEQSKGEDLENVQIKIEDFLLNQETTYFNESESKDIMNFGSENYDFLVEKIDELCKLMSDWDKVKKTSKSKDEEYIEWIPKIVKELNTKRISAVILYIFLNVITNESSIVDEVHTPGIPTPELSNRLGKKLINLYIYSLYLKEKKIVKKLNNTDLSLSEFKKQLPDEFSVIQDDDNFIPNVGGYFLWTLDTVGLLYQVLDSKATNGKEHQYYMRVNQTVRKRFIQENHKSFHLPINLPMICKPKDFVFDSKNNMNKLGGYLLNDVQYTDNIFKKKIGYKIDTTLQDKNVIVDLINGLSSTPYKINTETLNFIYQYGIEKNMVINPDKQEYKKYLDNPYKSFNKRDSKMYRSIISKIIMEKNILSIAQIYSKIEKIYFPVRLDFRTRIYCETDYFDYQKSDLAKGLISFTDPGQIYKHDIECIKYFKAFGANMYGNDLDKKSLNYRAKWVDDNMNIILDFENNNIVDQAENKTCFVSFCYEYIKFIKYMNDNNKVVFYTYLPIQLDASCNGYQHLALLTKETKLFNKLNLDSSNYDDKPDDFYAYILTKTEEYIEDKIANLQTLSKLTEKEENNLNSLILLSKINLDRSIVKKAIMTKSYNSGIPKQIDLILENLDLHTEGNNKYYTYKNSVKFKRLDICTLVVVIKKVIETESPRIKELSKYLEGIVSICTTLNIPIPWVLPSGVTINSSYNLVKAEKLKAFTFVKSKYTFRKYLKDKYDLKKQMRALMPNLIHSLDATSIALLYEEFKKFGSIYTIHDCFAVTVDKVPKLISRLKVVYMKIYSNTGYLIQFDNLVRAFINKTQGDKVLKIDGEFIYLGPKFKKTSYPDVRKALNLDSNSNKIEKLNNSVYIIK